MKRNRVPNMTKAIMIATMLLQTTVRAEDTPLPSTPIPINQIRNTGGFYSDPGTIADNSAVNAVSGRELKANDATNQANSGQGAAIAAGVALTAAAAAAFAALDIPRGTTLMTMAGLEFAQAGADNGVAGLNNAQENLLRAEAGQTATQSNTNSVTSQMDPSVPAVLGRMGVADPEAFLNDLVSGNITSPEQVLDGIGQSGNFNEGQVAAMGDFSQVNVAEVLGQEEGNAAAAILGYNDASGTVPTASASAGGAGGRGMDGKSSEGSSNQEPGAGTVFIDGIRGGRGLASLGANGEAAGSFAVHANGKDGATGARGLADAFDGFNRSDLKKIGILKPHGKTNIFQIASRNYRSFHAWRKARRFARPDSATQVAKAVNYKLELGKN